MSQNLSSAAVVIGALRVKWIADFFSKSTFLKNYFGNTIRVSNGLDPDQDQHSVGPDLGPNCLQWLSADDTTSKQSFNLITILSSATYFQLYI